MAANVPDYAGLAESALAEDMRAHNLVVLRNIVGGSELVLKDPVRFSPREDFRSYPERRFLVTYLANHFRRWPGGRADLAMAEFVVALSRHLEDARAAGVLHEPAYTYEDVGGIQAVFSSLRPVLERVQTPADWKDFAPRRIASRGASGSLLQFFDILMTDGFAKHEKSLGFNFRWFGALGTTSVEDLERRQRWFLAFKNAFLCTNSYRVGGSLFFGPIIGNTPFDVFLDSLQKWRNGKTLDEAPLMAFARTDKEPQDYSNNNMVRELWGFLNLHRQPFYNKRVAAYKSGHDDPMRAVAAIGEETKAWVKDHPEESARLARRFDELLNDRSTESEFPRYYARGRRRGKPNRFEQVFYDDLHREAVGVLSKLQVEEKAAAILHLAMDNAYYKESRKGAEIREQTGTYSSDSPLTSLRDYPRVWLYAPGTRASNWQADHATGCASLDYAEIDALSSYESRDDIYAALTEAREEPGNPTGEARNCWRFANDIQEGDPIIARKGKRVVVGVGVVTGPYRRVDGPFGDQIPVRWLWKGQYKIKDKTRMPMSALSEASRRKALLQELDALLQSEGVRSIADTDSVEYEDYTLGDALSDLFMDESVVTDIVELLRRKKNVVLQGPPGVGKTFVAKRLAYLILGARDPNRLRLVQFHQAYTYEQFVRGYRPDGEGGFELANGPLYDMAEVAKSDPDNDYVLIIDEINRGNLSKILGEGMMLLEADKRSEKWAVQLAYTRDTGGDDSDETEEPFYLPANLYVIGTMNTADRSLAAIDYALRRRFSFVTLLPGFDHARFREHLAELPAAVLDELLRKLREVNQMIADDPNLGAGFEIGHSYFCKDAETDDTPWGESAERWLDGILRYEVLPLLHEYWYDDTTSLERARDRLGLG